ncbi:outer dense fiber protein 2-like isoform X2 [Antennarius striatus]|uniref:outer dense fiber protein 2-like isoform X2 n=1 Tax=Antennarius striatus TaxID=241820 RepID=UPI0035B0F40E
MNSKVPASVSSTQEDAGMSCGDLAASDEVIPGSQETDPNCQRNYKESLFLKMLSDAEAASNAAAIQLVSFQDSMDSRHLATNKHQLTRQKGLLLEKLEDFKQKNKSVRQKFKQLQEMEAGRIDVNDQIDMLLRKVSQADSENEHLKSDLRVTERRLEEAMDLRREGQENLKSAVNLTKSVEAICTHLQGQLLNKEAENSSLSEHIQSLEGTLAEQKLKIDDLKGCISSLTVKAEQDKESFRKATRAQKQRAERFEVAIEKCFAQLKEKEAQLTSARLERDSKRQQKEQMMDETNKLIARVELLQSQIADLTAKLQSEKDEFTAVNESATQLVEKLRAENEELSIDNAGLKVSLTKLEQQLADSESALLEETAVCQEWKHQAEQCRCQITELQTEIDDLRIKYVKLLREMNKARDEKETEVEKMGSQAKLLRCTAEMRESIHEANLELQEKVNHLYNQIDKLQQENLELVRRLAAQEEAQSYSNRQLDERSSECHALSRQLEAALSDVKQQVNKVKDQASSKEKFLQTKILELEAEKSRRENELRLLVQSKHSLEKQFEVRLNDLQLRLDQSESRKQSIQNYVDFLKNSYKTMFVEGLQTSTFASSPYVLK